MTRWFTSLSLNARLALVAFVLGAVAIAASPAPGGSVRLDAADLAAIVSREADHVTPRELADWIIQGRADYRLIDLRDEAAFKAYFIPTAEHVPLARLAEYPWGRNERLVLYSDGGIHAAQAWFLLKARGFKGVYTLRGGLDAWKDEILFPRLPEHPAPAEVESLERLTAISRHFGGTPRVGGPADAAGGSLAALPMPEMPRVVAPAGGLGTKTPARKKKEGC